jgi:hypothetical protein
MIRVYFRTGRNTIRSRVYNANSINVRHGGNLEVNRLDHKTVTEESKVPNFLPWAKPEMITRRKTTTHPVAEFAPGEWMRWEAEEPEKKEKKSAKDEVRT